MGQYFASRERTEWGSDLKASAIAAPSPIARSRGAMKSSHTGRVSSASVLSSSDAALQVPVPGSVSPGRCAGRVGGDAGACVQRSIARPRSDGKDEDSKHRWLYWCRLGIAHFAEAASYLRDTTKIPEISAFIDSLPAHVRGHLRECLDCYSENEEVIERIRNEAGFHYPELEIREGKRRKRPMEAVLAALGGNYGQIVGETIGDARLLFADDIASVFVLRAHGGGLTMSAVKDLDVLGQVPH